MPTSVVDTSIGRSSLQVGHDYPRQELFDDVKMPDQPFGRWFRGSAVPGGDSNSSSSNSSSTCFLLNGNRQSWHYGWQSSRLNCKNLHVFKVYIFDASTSVNASTLTCVAALTSPSFRISSSRKARKTFRSPMAQAALANVNAPNITVSVMGIPMHQGVLSSGGSAGVASPPPGPVRSIDEFLGNSNGTANVSANAAAMYPGAQRQPPTGFMSRPMAQRDPARRERKRLTRLQGMIPEGGGIPLMMMSPGSSPDSYLNRKRNRSTDSDKAITAAIEASEKIHFAPSPLSGGGPGLSLAVVAPVPTDSELYRRARILQLAFTIVKRIHRFEEVAKQQYPKPKVYRHSFDMITPPLPTPVTAGPMETPRSQRKKCTLVQIPLSNPKLLYLCSNLVTVCTTLVSSGLLEDMRLKMHDCAQAGRGVLAAYAQLVDLLNDAVEAQISRLPRRMHKSWGDAESADEGEWDLYEMLKSCEPWLMQEPWWVVLDDDDQQQAGDREEGALRPLPYMSVFADYYHAIQDAVPSPQDLEVAASLRKAALTGANGLTGEWNRQGEIDDHLQPQRVASVRSASAASSLSWLARCIHAHTTQVFHITETDTTMTLTLPNSLVSADAVFLLQLDQTEPTVVLPQDYFPFGWSHKRSLVAYRAWRVRNIGDSNGSAVAVQFMRWPDSNELEEVESDEVEEELGDDEAEDSPEEPEEEPLARRSRQLKRLRTRITIYFSVFSSTTLQLRTIVESSLAPVAALPASSTAQPTEADMLRYFKSPSSWEMRSQISHQYEKNL
ncbi:hypothetical protein BBJ29_008106 [Phytophthora kernoviae]|uniref:Uncharacterized protein n=1 Tax=Phytophthora kernoviae TaxID=325452 RepID=A0A3F2RER7_9STRA|nr:hypothetical protein BBP00_00008666 [Phytophthora kernoviae]RLN66674.1 hypothetical protein BBJ29_008106 [Phytophthora kernoviae]